MCLYRNLWGKVTRSASTEWLSGDETGMFLFENLEEHRCLRSVAAISGTSAHKGCQTRLPPAPLSTEVMPASYVCTCSLPVAVLQVTASRQAFRFDFKGAARRSLTIGQYSVDMETSRECRRITCGGILIELSVLEVPVRPNSGPFPRDMTPGVLSP